MFLNICCSLKACVYILVPSHAHCHSVVVEQKYEWGLGSMISLDSNILFYIFAKTSIGHLYGVRPPVQHTYTRRSKNGNSLSGWCLTSVYVFFYYFVWGGVGSYIYVWVGYYFGHLKSESLCKLGDYHPLGRWSCNISDYQYQTSAFYICVFDDS